MHLYVYDHCPFCVKARMIFGLHQHPCEVTFLANDDEATPTELIGKKMLPILVKPEGTAMGESLDIIAYVEQLLTPKLAAVRSEALAGWLEKINGYVNRLLLPVLPTTDFAEFSSQRARDYFTNKKQAFIGDFTELRTERANLVAQVNADLITLESLIANEQAVNGVLSLDDIHLFPLLRNLTLINEIVWPNKVAKLRDNLAQQSGVPLLFHLAK